MSMLYFQASVEKLNTAASDLGSCDNTDGNEAGEGEKEKDLSANLPKSQNPKPPYFIAFLRYCTNWYKYYGQIYKR